MKTGKTAPYVPAHRRAGDALATLLEWLNDERISRYPLFHSLSEKLDRPPSVLANAALLFFLATLLLNPSNLSGPLTNAIGLSIPAYSSLKHVSEVSRTRDEDSENTSIAPKGKKKDLDRQARENTRRWLDYWLLYSTSLLVESFFHSETLVASLPFWWVVKALLIVWFVVGPGGGTKKKDAHKPKPLRLRPRSVIASAPKLETSSEQETANKPAPSGRGTHVNEGDDEISDSSASDTDTDSESEVEGAAAVDSALQRERKRIRDELAEHSPLLSAAPVGVAGEPRTAVTPLVSSDSEGSPFDLSDGSLQTSESDPHSSNSDIGSDISDATASDSGSEVSTLNSHSSDSESAHSDGSDEVVLPPRTPLDELALRGKKTKRTPSPDSATGSGSEDENDAQIKLDENAIQLAPEVQRLLKDDLDSNRREKSDTARQAAKGVVEGGNEPKSEKKDKDESAGTDSDGTETGSSESDTDSDSAEDAKSPSVRETVKVIEAQRPVEQEGQVVKLSVEDLLAMDGEGGQKEVDPTKVNG